jgi:hypothetical protein
MGCCVIRGHICVPSRKREKPSTKQGNDCVFVVVDHVFSKMAIMVSWSLLDTKLTKSTTFHPQTDSQTEVVNRMIVHILHMYNSNHPHTWDESLPYVQHSYNQTLHSSTNHNPF